MLTSGIYLEVGGASRPTSDAWLSYLAAMKKTFAAHSVDPGYYIIDNLYGEGRFKQYGTSAYEARLSKGFADVEFVALAATPTGLKEPGYNWTSLCNTTYIEGYGRLSIELMIDEQHCPFGGGLFKSSLEALGGLRSWDFGWCMSRDRAKGIQFYLCGGGSGDGISPADDKHIGQWYACYQPEDRRKRVRDIFPYNMVGPEHLARSLPDGRSLRDFIEGDADSELRRLADNLWLWKVKADRTEAMRDKLLGTGIIIAE